MDEFIAAIEELGDLLATEIDLTDRDILRLVNTIIEEGNKPAAPDAAKRDACVNCKALYWQFQAVHNDDGCEYIRHCGHCGEVQMIRAYGWTTFFDGKGAESAKKGGE